MTISIIWSNEPGQLEGFDSMQYLQLLIATLGNLPTQETKAEGHRTAAATAAEPSLL